MGTASTRDPGLRTTRLKVGKPHLSFTQNKSAVGAPLEYWVWLQERLEDDWVACYRLVPDGAGSFKIGSVRLEPYGESQVDAPTVETYRQLKTVGALREAADIAAWFASEGYDDAFVQRITERFGMPEMVGGAVRPRGANTPADIELAHAAQAWVGHFDGGSSSPTKDIAVDLCISHSAAAKRIAKARLRGVLTSSGRGRLEGSLTDYGHELLAGPAGSAVPRIPN